MAGKIIVRDRGLNRLLRSWRKTVASSRHGGPAVTVGIQAAEGSQEHEGGITNLVLAIIHEFGTATIPARSFVRSTVDVFKSKYRRMLQDIGQRALKGGNLAQGLFVLGETARADMIRRIQNAEIKQDLAPSTQRQRGEAGPALVDEGQLINAISSVVIA
jgi:hypothetical protein